MGVSLDDGATLCATQVIICVQHRSSSVCNTGHHRRERQSLHLRHWVFWAAWEPGIRLVGKAQQVLW